MKETIAKRIEALRADMKAHSIAATIIPQTDPHQSEYLGAHWQLRRWLSGFTGSAGSLVVTADKAYVWADSRYWIQARRQLEDTPIGVMEEGKPEVPGIAEFLAENLSRGETLGIDGMLFSIGQVEALTAALRPKGIAVDDAYDPADRLWTDRPSLPADKVFIHSEEFAGESAGSKIDRIIGAASAVGADSAFISDLAEIAWTLNIRSNDVKFNPVATSYLYISPKGSTLFIDPAKLTEESAGYLAAAGATTAGYTEVLKFLAALPDSEQVAINPATTSRRVLTTLGEGRALAAPSLIAYMKGCKNPVQIESVRKAMEYDGVALVKAFMEIERIMAAGETLTEIGVADLLEKYRSQQPGYMQPSFGTIAGYGEHGAIVHYEATPETDATLHPDNLLLVDSGGNYHSGTTDITRTITLGKTTDAQRHDFTLVMKGHIALASAIYPEGTRGDQLDALARINLWKEGLSYLHGTGHGVGFFLNCHEGPQSVRLNHVEADLRPGMITSDEPGLYREGLYGIRCENLVLTTEAFSTEFGRFYKFEVLTLFPFDRNLFDKSIMTADEIAWVDNYHHTVYSRLSPLLDKAECDWLREKTLPL